MVATCHFRDWKRNHCLEISTTFPSFIMKRSFTSSVLCMPRRIE